MHGGTVGKESVCQCRHMGDAGLIPGPGRSPKEGNSNLLQYSCLENSMGRGAWQATVNGIAQSQTRLSTSACTHALLPLQAPTAAFLWLECTELLLFLGINRSHNCLLSMYYIPGCRRKWQPAPVFLPGEPRGQGSLVGCCPWGSTESDRTEVT